MGAIAEWLCLLMVLVVGQGFASPLQLVNPLYYEPEARPLATVGQRLASLTRPHDPSGDARPRDPGADARLPLPSPQDLDAIKKVAQILIMLGEQVIPSIIGSLAPPPPRPGSGSPAAAPVQDAPNDPVNLD